MRWNGQLVVTIIGDMDPVQSKIRRTYRTRNQLVCTLVFRQQIVELGHARRNH